MTMYIDNNNYNMMTENSNNYEYIEDNCFECDEIMAHIISLLNMKGYNTKYCCSGHINMNYCTEQDSYIYFMSWVEVEKLDIPEGWVIENNHTIRKYYRNGKEYFRNPYSFYKELSESMYELYEWAYKLPYLNTMENQKLDVRKQFFMNAKNYFSTNDFCYKRMTYRNDFSYQCYYDSQRLYTFNLLDDLDAAIGQECTVDGMIKRYNTLIEKYVKDPYTLA